MPADSASNFSLSAVGTCVMKLRIALFFALVLLGGCESMGLDFRSGSSAREASEPAAVSSETEEQPAAEPAPAADQSQSQT